MAWWICIVSICLAACLVMGAMHKPEIAAHRGENSVAPENTLSSFKLAWARHDDAIELDIHLTRDGQVIVCHDCDTQRTTGESHKIKNCTLEQLRRLDAGSWKDPRYAGERLPLLSEVLATIPSGKRCFIEIKVGPEIIPALRQIIQASGQKPGQLPIISFHADALAEARNQLPDHQCYYLASFKKDERSGKWTPTCDELIKVAHKIGADGLDLSHQGPVNADFVHQVKAAGLQMYVWTVDDPAVARKMMNAGVDGITTNKAQWIGQQLGLRQ